MPFLNWFTGGNRRFRRSTKAGKAVRRPAFPTLKVCELEDRITPAVPVRPTGLNPGDKFHVMFVTSGTTTATSTAFSPYDTFVQTAAASAGINTYAGGSVTWNALVSSHSAGHAANRFKPSTPIYRMDGARIENDGANLWGNDNDYNIINPIDRNEYGNQVSASQVWTGTLHNGLAAYHTYNAGTIKNPNYVTDYYGMGNSSVMFGHTKRP